MADSRRPPHFQWVVEEKVAALAFPSKPAHIRWLLDNGVRHLVSLQDFPEPPVKGFPEMKWTKISMPEFSPPSLQQSEEFVALVEESLARKEPVAVHCTFGHGRTGTMIACYFAKHFDLEWRDAIDKLRSIRKYSVETWKQELAVRKYCFKKMGFPDDLDYDKAEDQWAL